MSEKILKDDELKAVAGGTDLRVIGTAKVLTTNLNIRTAADKNSECLGQTNYPAKFDVYEIVQNQGFVWYRIATRMWIANDGTWVAFTAK